MAGYHLADIPRGKIGELSKVLEEIHEAIDAEDQDAKIMVLIELSDAYGAMKLYLEKHFPDVSMEDLATMSAITRRAFEGGHRKSND